MARCLIGLGSNLFERSQLLDRCVALMGNMPEVSVTRVSRWLSNPALGGPPNQPDFLNGAVCLQTDLPPQELLARLRHVESQLGRVRRVRWAARTIDIDLLLYDDWQLDDPDLTIPHPRMVVRRFVLEPAVEIAADWEHPGIGWSLARLLEHLKHHPPRFTLCGFSTLGWRGMASKVQARLRCQTAFDEPPVDLAAGSSLNPHQHLECLERRANVLVASGWNSPSSPILADFWIEESRLLAEFGLPEPEQRRMRAAIDSWRDRVSASKLLVVWRNPSDRPADSLERRFCDRLYRVAMERRCAPVLGIVADDPDVVVDEIVAAIEGMQSANTLDAA